MRAGFERSFLAWAWSSQVLAILAVAADLLPRTGGGSSPAALAYGSPIAIVVVLLARRRFSRPMLGLGSVVVVVGASIVLVVTGAAAAILILVGVLGAVLAEFLAARFPADLDGAYRRRRVLALLCGLVAMLGLGRGTLLTLFMADARQGWASTAPFVAESVKHECLPAYLYAGELSARGVDDVYDPAWYPFEGRDADEQSDPAPRPQANVDTAVLGMEEAVADPFLYPPPFLLIPRAALSISHDFARLRLGVFAANAVGFLIVGLALASWIGGKRGLVAGLLLPLVWSSTPVLFNFQLGQFQLMAIVLSIGAMLAFDRERHALGGLLLAIAILGKVFPGILALWLLFRGAWRAASWTVGWGIALIALSLAVIGPATFEHFLFEQIPRLASGDVPPYFKDSLFRIGANISVYALPFKLHALGWLGSAETIAILLNWCFVLALVAFAYRSARGTTRDRHTLALAWAALLALASLRSPYVPSVYGYAGAIWLLSLLAGRVDGRAWRIVAVVLAWALLGPLPPVDDQVLTVGLSLLGPFVFLFIGFLALKPPRSRAEARPFED